ncbi:MAG: hypothetical protein GX607_17955 [Myxococcales bacterium]|jgi:hypothetical protein|nr:hypothetical protein [Myxococcales bacterium]
MSWAMKRGAFLAALATAWLAVAGGLGCERSSKKSVQEAREHVAFLAELAARDVDEVREGLPGGAKHLEALFREAAPELPNPQTAAKAMDRARDADAKLRIAKSTFFAVTTVDGQVLRASPPPDDLTGKNIFTGFPDLKNASSSGYAEARGSMPEVAGVRGKEDAQWAAAAAIRLEDAAKGLYVAGWSWSAYAYRLQTALRSKILTEAQEGDKIPLLYVYVIVGDGVYGEPIAPVVNARAIAEQKPLEQQEGSEPFTAELEIEGRAFGLAVLPIEKLGKDVGIAVLRSET